MQLHHRFLPLLLGLAGAACTGSSDNLPPTPSAGASGAGGETASGGGGGFGGSDDSGLGGSGFAGSGGAAGGEAEIRDASADATDSSAPRSQCQNLDVYCSQNSHAFIARCPDFASARQELRQAGFNAIVQRPCVGAGGAARVAVHATIGAPYTTTLIYDAATGALVGADFEDDIEFGCFGETSPDCKTTSRFSFEGCDGGVQEVPDASSVECVVDAPDASAP